jgi:hypothetical protein
MSVFVAGVKLEPSKVDLSWQVVGRNNCRVCVYVCRKMLRSKEKSEWNCRNEMEDVVEESTELNCIIPSHVRISLPRCRRLISESDYRKAL